MPTTVTDRFGEIPVGSRFKWGSKGIVFNKTRPDWGECVSDGSLSMAFSAYAPVTVLDSPAAVAPEASPSQGGDDVTGDTLNAPKGAPVSAAPKQHTPGQTTPARKFGGATVPGQTTVTPGT